jgi:hypothetical protein
MENIELRNTVSNQKLIIDYLSQQLVKDMNTKMVDNLLEFD